MYDFPQDLLDSLIALHRTRSEYEQCVRTLPWSAEPMPGWQADKQLHSDYRPSKPDSPGCTDEQRQQVAAYRKRLLDLGIQVSTHPFLQTLGPGLVVEGRMQLKHVDDKQPETMAEAA
ncbi:hypothetical protein [Streptomyces sp. SM13]|uniref:hypothetical protein n=1 Tax=Streptomyces sp. SM13 TaxID=1983803 RepID=UPI000CD49C9E|nr:hypothetical protein [Streptomyces sp. SM13]